MSYAELIRQEGEYTYSANIQFDITTDTKLLRYIPNETSITLLREYFLDITRAHPYNHARILYGSYGTGKSHFLTVLAQILEKSFTTGVAFSTFLSRVKEYDDALAYDIKSFAETVDRKPMLVVPIVFDFDDFDRCIYFSLKKKLDALGISIHYKTFFDQASSLLRQWQSTQESSDRLAQACKAAQLDLDELTRSLELLNPKAEKSFNKLFEAMTYGVKFVYEASNMFEILNQTNDAIKENYSGIVFIFDEFGRYIEDNLKKIRVKAVQYFAEYCDHCDGNNHIILVSHKEISQYTEHHSKSVSAEWKKVEGRYKAFSINSKQDQSLDIIRSVLLKNEPVWSNFKLTFMHDLADMYSTAIDFRGYSIRQGDENPYEAAFPLHPFSLYALDRLSKKVAQNDRTFFTYLAGKEPNSLYRFLAQMPIDEFHYVGIDEIFDYFEPSIKSVQSDDTFEWYKRLQSALAKGNLDEYSNDIRVRVLKVVATIGIINDTSTLSADSNTIEKSIDADSDLIKEALSSLCEQKILKYSGLYQQYEFFDASIFDVGGMIEEEALRVSDDAVVKALNENFVNFVLYPHTYNREYSITRVFAPVFASTSELSGKLLTQKLGKYYDGALVLLLGADDTVIDGVIASSDCFDRCIIWLCTEPQILAELVKKYIAAKYLETQTSKYNAKDPAFAKELQYHIREIVATVEEQISIWKSFSPGYSTIIANGEIQPDIQTMGQLSDLASAIMFRAYPDTLIVNNELINKNTISGSMASAKKNAIRCLLQENNTEPYYGLQYLSPDYITVRSVLCKNGFVSFDDDLTLNSTVTGRRPQTAVKQKLEEYITQAQNNTIAFADLYAELKASPYGLRDGYISLLIACFLVQYKKTLIVSSHGSEQELSAELFEDIVKRPGDFCFTVAVWTKEEMAFVDALENTFQQKIDTSKLTRNRLKAVYDGMLSHYKSVSKFSRTTTRYVSDATLRYRQLMERSHTSYTHFFFEEAKDLTGNFEASIRSICDSKAELDGALNTLCQDLKRVLCSTFTLDFDLPLAGSLLGRYATEWESKRIKSFDYYTNAFLDYVGKLKEDCPDYHLLCQLAKLLSGIDISYWSDNHRDEFESRLGEINVKLSAYNATAGLQNEETKMTLTTSSGEERTVVFDNSGLTDIGVTIKNKINSTFSNFGLAVTYDDKVQVLLSILNDLMEGK